MKPTMESMTRKLTSVMFLMVIVMACGAQLARAAMVWDAYTQFNGTSNTSTDTWQYMLTTTPDLNDNYALLPYYDLGNNGWFAVDGNDPRTPWVLKPAPDGKLHMHPYAVGIGGDNQQASVLAWKSPITGLVNVTFTDTRVGGDAEQSSKYILFKGTESVALTSGILAGSGATSGTISLNASVTAGEMLYFQIAPWGNNWNDENTVSFTIAEVPEPAALTLLGVGLAVCAWRRRR